MSVGKLSEFDVKTGQWSSYVDRLEMFFLVNKVTAELKLPTLISTIGDEAYELLVNLSSPKKPSELSYDAAIGLMSQHLHPTPSSLTERYRFRQKRQGADENVATYVTELKRLARYCKFAGNLNENLRDQFICGLKSDVIRQRLFAEDDSITFLQAVKLANALEAAERDAAMVEDTATSNSTAEAAHSITSRADCDWDGVKGKCVKETQCFTTLARHSDHPICSTKGEDKIVCCTDCELINSTRNVVMSPRSGYFWKDGTKARDSCLVYLDTLPYKCRDGGFYSGISKHYDEEKKCHIIGLWGIGGSPPHPYEPGVEYPYLALLGYGNDLESVTWGASGTIISNKYILTSALIGSRLSSEGPLKYIALGVFKFTDGPSAWQIHNVKRLIRHPEHSPHSMYNDIALIEIEDTITFNKNVLPACLPVTAADDEKAVYITWTHLVPPGSNGSGVHAEPVNVEKFSEEECKAAYTPTELQLDVGLDNSKQMCYGTKETPRQACKGHPGEPLVISTQFSGCIYTVIGVTSFGRSQCGSKHNFPDVYTRVAYYKPWIESVVWP